MWNDQCDLSDEECGKHSGILECCRRFYIEVWAPFFENWPIELPFVAELYEWDAVAWPKYVQCPGCRATGAFVHIKPCPIER